MSMPKVSVIMATYNCENTVKKSVESIICQTYSDWEFIICDDCSADHTFLILEGYAQKYPGKIIVIRNDKNSKLAFSLNRCLSIVKGEYVARMDGDDESFPERLEKQVKFLDSHPEYAVVGTSMIPFDEKGDKPIRYAKEIPTAKDMLSRSPIFHATIMMRKTAYDAVKGYSVSKRTQRAQDYDMWFRFFALGLKAYSLQEGLYHVLEDDQAFKRRTPKSRFYEVQTRLKGYKMLHYPWYLYIFAFKPLLAAFIPMAVIKKYHVFTDKKRCSFKKGAISDPDCPRKLLQAGSSMEKTEKS